jgi:hypothetical protein
MLIDAGLPSDAAAADSGADTGTDAADAGCFPEETAVADAGCAR